MNNRNHNQLKMGIDLGTTSSQVAIENDAGVIEVLANSDGDLVSPVDFRVPWRFFNKAIRTTRSVRSFC